MALAHSVTGKSKRKERGPLTFQTLAKRPNGQTEHSGRKRKKKNKNKTKKARAEPLDFFRLLLCVQSGAVWGNLIQDASVPYSPQKGIKLLGVREKNEQR